MPRYLTGKPFLGFFVGMFPLEEGNTFCDIFYVRYSILLHLPPFRFHIVGGCWVETRTVVTLALALRRFNHSARSHPTRAISHPTDLLWYVYKKRDDMRGFDC